MFGGLADFLAALDFLGPDIEQADGRARLDRTARSPSRRPSPPAPPDDDASPPMVAPRSSTTESPRIVGHTPAMRRAVDPRQRAQVEARHRHQRAGIAGGDRDIGLALLHGVDRKPHRRVLAAAAQRLARLVVHADGDVGMDDARGRLQAPDIWRAALRSARCRRTAGIRCRDAGSMQIAAPGMTTDAPTSPPMASSAIRTF